MRVLLRFFIFSMTVSVGASSCRMRPTDTAARLAADGDEEPGKDDSGLVAGERAAMAQQSHDFTVIAQAYGRGFFEFAYLGTRAAYPTTAELVQLAGEIAGDERNARFVYWSDVLKAATIPTQHPLTYLCQARHAAISKIER